MLLTEIAPTHIHTKKSSLLSNYFWAVKPFFVFMFKRNITVTITEKKKKQTNKQNSLKFKKKVKAAASKKRGERCHPFYKLTNVPHLHNVVIFTKGVSPF
jgi:hypothetical protein